MTDRTHRPRRMATRVRTPPRTGATSERPNERRGLRPGHAPHGSQPRRLAPMRAPRAQPSSLVPRLLLARVSPDLPSRPLPPEHAPRCASGGRLSTEGASESVRTRYRHYQGLGHPPHLNDCAKLGAASRAHTAAATTRHPCVVLLAVLAHPPI